jgi:diguanylate cyclase (GGDEF)-like protein
MTEVGHRWLPDVDLYISSLIGDIPSPRIKDQPLSPLALQPPPSGPMYLSMGEGPIHRGQAARARRHDPAQRSVTSPTARLLVLLGLLASVVAAAVPAWLGLSDRPWPAFSTGLVLTGISAVGTGLVMIGWWIVRRRTVAVEVFRLLFGLAVLCWGSGQLVSAVDATDGVVNYPAIGDAVGFVAAPLVLVGILYLPRRSVSLLPGLRLVLDSLAVGAALTFMLLRGVLAWPGAGLTLHHLTSGVFVLADCAVFAALLLASVRDLRSGFWPTALGMFCHMIADLSVIVSVEGGGFRVDPWLSMSLWCLAWPLFGVGIVRFRWSPASVGEGAQDRREAAATQLATVITFAALLAGVLFGGGLGSQTASRGSLLLVLLIVPVLCLREVMGAHLRLKLTTGLRAQAFRDPLTGLANRRALTTRIDELDQDDVPRVVLTLDLDGFKQVNDLLGHQGADTLLIAVADTLQKYSPPVALVSRIGGDEFAVLCPGDLAEGRLLAERLRVAVRKALDLKAPGVGISASVGVGRLVRSAPGDAGQSDESTPAQIPSGTEHRDQLTGLVESAAALRAAKESGRDAVQVYDGDMGQARQRRLLLEYRLRHAIAHRTIITYGQPIVDLGTGRLAGFESLARWNDAELGFVPPDEFIAVAEQTGLVVALGEHLLEETLAAAAAAGVFAAGLTLSVNASPIQLRVPGFVELIREQMSRHRIGPAQMIIEITEAILVAEGDPAVSTLAEINALGIGLAIDDFGTGYSALGYLRRLPVQVIKIDKSLTSSLNSEPKTLAIVEGVARMAHRMGVRVVMEGIEDEREAEVCRMVGADRGQGYLFGRPTPWDQAAKLITEMALRPDRPAVDQAAQPMQGELAVAGVDQGAQAGAGRESATGTQRPPDNS